MTKDYEEARDHFSQSAVKAMAQLGNERAVQRFLGAIDALTVAVFAANGGGGKGAIGLAIDNTQPVEPPCDVSPAA